jgi:hypothetical protein
MTETLRVTVSYSPSCGFVSEANHRVPRSLTAASLDALRRRLIIMILSRRRDEPISVRLDLDAAAAQEAARRAAGEVHPGPECG